jgi:hypothetical protein
MIYIVNSKDRAVLLLQTSRVGQTRLQASGTVFCQCTRSVDWNWFKVLTWDNKIEPPCAHCTVLKTCCANGNYTIIDPDGIYQLSFNFFNHKYKIL